MLGGIEVKITGVPVWLSRPRNPDMMVTPKLLTSKPRHSDYRRLYIEGYFVTSKDLNDFLRSETERAFYAARAQGPVLQSNGCWGTGLKYKAFDDYEANREGEGGK